MSDPVTTTFLLVPGPWRSAGVVLDALAEIEPGARERGTVPVGRGDVALEVVEDPDLAAAIAWGRRGRLPAPLLDQVGAIGRAVLVEVGLRPDEDAARFARIGRALRDAGGLAVRMEASGCASTWDEWLPRMERGLPGDLVSVTVIIVAEDDGRFFTCGMHAFDLPDAEVDLGEESSSMQWLETFCVYQLAEQPLLRSGDTFRPAEGVARRTMERWPDDRHAGGDGRHNPFGLWRFVPDGSSRVQPGALALVITPPLVSLLAEAEERLARPLTVEEVEQLVEGAPSMTMERAHARTLERARGYADIEPELAWEQWQLVRVTL